MDPLYVDYTLWEKRLSTFDESFKFKSKCSHSREELAIAGFFYAGFSDCVRCFYCGLGLKAWNRDDNVYVEHQRHRPNCQFFQAIVESNCKVEYDLLFKDHVINNEKSEAASTSEELALLQLENKYLKRQRLCRVCFRKQARELFLPCGEIIVCDSCSDMITTCPSCKGNITATASVFML